MGLQQILLIVLSVIIVGVAISVGIVMFTNQAYSSNRTALLNELNHFASLAIQYWKVPTALGGAGQQAENISIEALSAYLGFSTGGGKVVAMNYEYYSENGTYRLTVDEVSIVFTGLGKEMRNDKHPLVTLTVNLVTGDIETEITEAEDFN